MLLVNTPIFWSIMTVFTCCFMSAVMSVTTTYSSALTNKHPTFYGSLNDRPANYYEVIHVMSTTADIFTLTINADVCAYLYRGYFYDTSNPYYNVFAWDCTRVGNDSFLLTVFLQACGGYTLIVVSRRKYQTTSFVIYGNSSSGMLSFTKLTIVGTTTTTTTTTAATTGPKVFCYPPEIDLFPNATSINGSAQFRRLQDFYISSDIRVPCFTLRAYRTQWTIYNCSSSCSEPIPLASSIMTKYSELFIPAKTFDYGIYRFELTATMNYSATCIQSASIYVEITATNITANLIQYGTSVITSGHLKNLTMNPGQYSVDPNTETFGLNASEWNYTYYCRPYDLYNPSNAFVPKVLEDSSNLCFSNRLYNQLPFLYTGSADSGKSSVIIPSGSLAPNQTYQFMVTMIHFQNVSNRATGYVTVKVESSKPQLIVISCVVSTMCAPNLEYQYVNPSTQVALFSSCMDDCASLTNIIWNIYQGSINSSTNNVRWTRFSGMDASSDYFFGINTSNFTATSQLFIENDNITYWRFEAFYSFESTNSSSALNFRINQKPTNGSCTIDPTNGTTSTMFTIYCRNWLDADDIQQYSVYVWTTNNASRLFLASNAARRFLVRLPARDSNASLVHLLVEIQDTYKCVTQFLLPSVVVLPETHKMRTLIDILQESITNDNDTDEIFGLPEEINQDIFGQVLTLVSHEFNDLSSHDVEMAIANGVAAATRISISRLGSIQIPEPSTPSNVSTLAEFNEQLNKQAKARENLLQMLPEPSYINSDVIKIQASTLAKITEATNQLTRQTCMIASNKCQNLSRILLSMVTRISREDVEFTAAYIAECATNVLTGVNGPLQERGSVLELDFNRSNAVPDDDDTDLESEWANEHLFADGDDYSPETIQKGRNRYYQRNLANVIADQVADIFSSLTATLNIHLNIGQHTTMNTSSVFVSMEALTKDTLSAKVIEQVAGAQIRLPSNFSLTINDSEKVYVRSIMQPLASVGSDSQSKTNTNFSTSVSLSLLDRDGHDLLLNVSMDEPIEFIIPRDPNALNSSSNWQYVSSMNGTNQSFNLHAVNILRNKKLNVSIHLDIHPVKTNVAYWFIYKFDGTPQVNSSITLIDGWTLFCPLNLTADDLYRYMIDNQKTFDHQLVVFGLRELNSTEMLHFCSNISINITLPIIADEPFDFSSDYELRTYTSGCYYLDSNNNWQSDGLTVGPLTDLHQTQCFSTHLTTFAGGFLALPLTINWDYVFANADFMQNQTIYITIICVCTLYLILLIFARFRDRKDLNKLGITFLPDNRKDDQYFYQIIVFTGHRKGAGTESKVHFVLGGDNDETDVRTLAGSDRKILQRSDIDAFILAVPKTLGPLNYLHIWHDNSGQGELASWFLKYIIVRDLQTMVKTHFICQQWLAVEEGDGAIERLLPVAGEYQKQQFSYALSKQAYHSMSDSHLWFSIFSRPPSSKFTRVQRCTCCFVLLFTVMLFNILYYEQAEAAKIIKNNIGLSFGPFYFSREEIAIGITIEILSFIPSLFLIQFFRRIRQRNSNRGNVSPIDKIMMGNANVSEKKKKHVKFTFPWWCIFVAYTLSMVVIGVSIFFIVVRSIELGDVRIQKWLTTIVVGFLSSICLTEPVKVLCLAIFFVIFVRNINDDDDMTEHINDSYHVDLMKNETHIQSNQDKSVLLSHLSSNRADRLNKYEVEEARRQRVQQIQMWSVIRELFSCLCFLWIIYTLTCSNRTNNAFLQANHLRRFFLNIGHADNDYTKIRSMNEYWSWLENTFVQNLRARRWYNGQRSFSLKGFTNDTSNRLIGWATMRQLRVKPNLCKGQSTIERLNLTCQSDYHLFNEEQHSFQPGWLDQTSMEYSFSIRNAFVYNSSKQLDTYVYMGNHGTYGSNGYVYQFRGHRNYLRSNLSELHRLAWIDKMTRAVIIQCTLYNPNAEMFTSVTLLAEFLSTGGVIPTARFEPIQLQAFTSLFHAVIAMIYLIFIVYFTMIEVQSLLHLKWTYFRQFWCYIEWSIIGCSWSAVGVYVWRYQEKHRLGHRFRETKGYVHINLQWVTYMNDVLIFLLGFCCFFGTVKLLRFCRFHRRLSLLGDTLRYAGKDLLYFTMTFWIVFMAFVVLFYFLFASKIWTCSSLLQTAETLFEVILMKFDATQIRTADAVLGPFCFTLFIFFVVFIGMTMFISIIRDGFRTVRHRSRFIYNEDYEMFAFIWNKFLRWIGWRKPGDWELQEERDKRMRSQYHDPIERFPQKIDQLLEALNRINTNERNDLPNKERINFTKRARCRRHS